MINSLYAGIFPQMATSPIPHALLHVISPYHPSEELGGPMFPNP